MTTLTTNKLRPSPSGSPNWRWSYCPAKHGTATDVLELGGVADGSDRLMAGSPVVTGGSRYAQAQLIGPGLCQQALRPYPGRLACHEPVKLLNFAATDGTERLDVDTLQLIEIVECREPIMPDVARHQSPLFGTMIHAHSRCGPRVTATNP